MPNTSARPDWDIFCKVVDNFGDIGVCWRLARQLASERHDRVRLWVDDLEPFKALCPQVDTTVASQTLQGIEVRRWETPCATPQPARRVLETFACRIPESFVAAMAQQTPPPVWINLDYLSAEAWVAGCHTLPSPHPQLPLTKFFFFPGFSDGTGGLLRERDLLARRQGFKANADLQKAFARQAGFALPSSGTLLVSLFAYDNPAIADLLQIWQDADLPICCLAPLPRTLTAIEDYAGQPLKAGDILRRGALEIRILPFLEQGLYDHLLWLCDLNFVRGEDSFVRAQWAARPLVWHIYPQQEAAHLTKLTAFLDIYCAALPMASATALREFWQAWNTGSVKTTQWQAFAASLPRLREHAQGWQEALAKQDDLSSQLVRFAASKL